MGFVAPTVVSAVHTSYRTALQCASAFSLSRSEQRADRLMASVAGDGEGALATRARRLACGSNLPKQQHTNKATADTQ